MGLRDRAARFLGRTLRLPPPGGVDGVEFSTPPLDGERASAPPPYAFATGLSGVSSQLIGSATPPDDLKQARGWNAMAAIAVADRLQSVPMELYRTVGTAEDRDQRVYAHPVVDLFTNFNPVWRRLGTLRLMSLWLSQAGQAYLLKVTDSLGIVRELWPMSPSLVTPVGNEFQAVQGYLYHSPRGVIEYGAEEVVRIWNPSPYAMLDAQGDYTGQRTGHYTSQYVDETMLHHFENDATPTVVIQYPKDSKAANEEQWKRFVREWAVAYHGRHGTQSGIPKQLPPGAEAHELNPFGGFTQTVETMEHYRDRVLMAHKVPRSILGDVVDANRNTAETNQYVFDRQAVLPKATVIEVGFTEQVVQPDFDQRLYVKFEQFVSQDKDHELKKEAQDLTLKVRSVNQVREDRGDDDVEWGELPVGTMGERPYDPEAIEEDRQAMQAALQGFDDPDDDTDTDDDDDPDRGSRSRGQATAEDGLSLQAVHRRLWSRAAVFSRLEQSEAKWTPRFAQAARRAFATQRTVLLDALESGQLVVQTRAARQNEIDLELLQALLEQSGATWQLETEPIRRQITREEGVSTLGLLTNAGEAAFFFTEAVREHVQQQSAEMISSVNETTRRRLRKQLDEAIAEGEGVSQIAARVRKVFRGRRSNAVAIARTEVLKATQWAQLDAFDQSGVVERKRWLTSKDEAVREPHANAEGQTVALNEPFLLFGEKGAEQADGPGVGHRGRRLSAGNAVNCRCRVVPIIFGDEDE